VISARRFRRTNSTTRASRGWPRKRASPTALRAFRHGRKIDGIVVNNLLATYSHFRSAGSHDWAARFVGFVRAWQDGAPRRRRWPRRTDARMSSNTVSTKRAAREWKGAAAVLGPLLNPPYRSCRESAISRSRENSLMTTVFQKPVGTAGAHPMLAGTVYLVGAARRSELLTLRAARLLAEAEVIVYDHLSRRLSSSWPQRGAAHLCR